MTVWMMELSPAGLQGFEASLWGMSPKNLQLYLRLLARIRRFGSAPVTENIIREMYGVTVRYFRERAWPVLQDWFELRDGRIYPVEAWEYPMLAQPPKPEADPALAERRKNAASVAGTRRWDAERARAEAALHGSAHAFTHPSTHANRMNGHAAAHAPTHAPTHSGGIDLDAPGPESAFADASPRARTLSLSSTNSPDRESQPSHTDSEGESSRGARERGHAPPHAVSCDSDALTDALPHGPERAPDTGTTTGPRPRPRSEPSAPKQQMRPDWRPSPAGEAEAHRRGLDLEATVEKFRNHWMARGDAMADFNPLFLTWCREDRKRADSRQQGHMVMAIGGGKAGDTPARPVEADDPAIAAPGPEGELARAKQRLKAEIDTAEYHIFVAPVTLGGVDADEAIICLPKGWLRDRVATQYADRLLALWQAENPALRWLRVHVAKVRKVADG